MLTNEQNTTFLRYAIKYKRSPNRKELIELQQHVFTQITDKSLENTAIQELVNLINDDIKNQCSFKQDLENKTGFLIALWGVLIASVFDTNIINILIANITNPKNHLLYLCINIVLISGLALFASLVLVEIILVFYASEYSQIPFNDKNTYYRCAVDDKNMFWVRILEVSTNVWNKYYETNEKKYKHFKRAVLYTGYFALFFVLCNCI